MRKIRYAMIGFGGIAENRIAKEGFARDTKRFPAAPEDYELIGAFDLNASRKPAVESYGLTWYDSMQSLLADEKVEAVFVATNNRSHAPMATAALEAGKHVLVEKPLATTVSDVQALIRLARQKGLSLAVDHMMVHNRLNKAAKELVESGKLGAVNDSCFHMEFLYGRDAAEAATWRCADPAELGGPIGDVASHCFYMAEFMFDDEIAEVCAVYLPKTLKIEVEDGAYIKFKMKGGMTGSVKVAFSEDRGGLGGTLTNLGFEIYGSDAILRSYGTMFQLSGHPDEPVKIRLELDTRGCQERITVDDGFIPNIYQTLIWHHARSIIDGKPMVPADGLRNVRQCLAAHQSAQNGGKPVRIEE